MMTNSPKAVLRAWVDAFDSGDAAAVAGFYAADAFNHQVAEPPVYGRDAIHAMFQRGFAAAKMVCIVENPFIRSLSDLS